MALRLYYIIQTVLLCANCAVMDDKKSEDNKAKNTHRKRQLQKFECNPCALEKSMSFLDNQFRLICCDNNAIEDCKRVKTDSSHRPLPSFNLAFGNIVGIHRFKEFENYAETRNSQAPKNEFGKVDQIYSSCKSGFATYSSQTCIETHIPWVENAHNCEFAKPFDIKDLNGCKDGDILQQNDDGSETNLNFHSKTGFKSLGTKIVNQKAKISRIRKATLPSKAKRLNEARNQFKPQNLPEANKDKFDEVLKRYQIKVESTNKVKSAPEFVFEIIGEDLSEFQIIQKKIYITNVNNILYQNTIEEKVLLYLPDFKKYYKRCGESLSTEMTCNIVFSQEWRSLLGKHANYMLYTDFSIQIAKFKSKLTENAIIVEIQKVCVNYHLNLNLVPPIADDVNDNLYDPDYYFLCSVVTQEEADLYVPIDTEKYTLDNADDYCGKFAIFKQFVFDTFFSKHPSQVFYTIKKEIGKLPMFIFEIYIYLTWRLTITDNISVDKGDKIYGLKEEIKNLADLADAFFRYSRLDNDSKSLLYTLKYCIDKVRFGILSMLKCHYGNTAMYQLYRIAHQSNPKNPYKDHFLRTRDIMSLLAFAPKTNYSKTFSKNLKIKDDNNKNMEKHHRLATFAYNCLGKSSSSKIEMIKIFITFINFFRKLLPKSAPQQKENYLAIAFCNHVVVISSVSELQSLKVKILSNCGCYVYFHRLIYNLFAY